MSKLPTAFTNLFQKVAAKKTSPVEIIDVDAKDINQSKSKKLKKVGREGAVDKSKGSRRVRGVGAQGMCSVLNIRVLGQVRVFNVHIQSKLL